MIWLGPSRRTSWHQAERAYFHAGTSQAAVVHGQGVTTPARARHPRGRITCLDACPRARQRIRATHNAPVGIVCHDRRMRPSVLIVDDHEDFRRSARAMLQAEGFVVVGEAGDGTEAIAKARDARPDVVLVDIQLPDLNGFVVADHIATWPDPPIVVLISSRDAAVYRSRLANTPARGFITKSHLSGEALADLMA
jgi:CheY-like chemotaxis protein